MKQAIALGMGNNIDYEITWNSSIFEERIVRYSIRNEELTVNQPINCERDLIVSILGFLKLGCGGERFVASAAIIEDFSQNFERRITLGGTSVRAAIAMRKLGYTAALHLVTMNEHVRSLIPPDSTYACSNPKETSYPHLIVQFGKGVRVCAGDIDIHVSRANRLIYVHDEDNVLMHLNEAFCDLLTDARVFMVSGFNAMQRADLLASRMQTLSRMFDCLPEGALVYYEDAGFHHPEFNQVVHAALVPRINIYGLNEDELQAHLGHELEVLNPMQVQGALTELQQRIRVPTIVVHTMYWALAYGENAMAVARALKGGVTMATTRFRCGDAFAVEDYRETEALAPNAEGVAFAGALKHLLADRVCCVPVPQVEQMGATTVGLGDAFVGGFLPALL